MNAAVKESLVEKWSEEFRSLPPGSGPDWLGALKSRAAQQLAISGLPDRKIEDWKYTPLRLLEQLGPVALGMAGPDSGGFTPPICRANAGTVDIGDGRLSGALPETTPGLTLLPLSEALTRFGDVLRPLFEGPELGSAGNAFTALNTAFMEHGLVVQVAEKVNAGTLLVRWAFNAANAVRMGNFRVVVLLEPGAKLNLVEQFDSEEPAVGALNIVYQADLAENAVFDHVRVQNESENSVILTATSVGQASRSRYRYSGFDLGGGLVRHGLVTKLSGAGAEADFDGAFVLDRKRHVDNHIAVEHAAPGCRSSQFFRGVLGGSSRGVFNGRALIQPGADGSSVRQSNANLLLSTLAEMDTKPELEIYADEVEASHGATVGQLDETAVFYLRSRGLGEEQARRILTTAFCHAVTDRLENGELAERVSALMDAAMPGLLPSA